MHRIEKHILSQLVKRDKCRYTDMKPSDVDGNHFTYYLDKFLDKEWVEKDDGRYYLTAKGKRKADKLSLEDYKPRIQPKIVTLIVCQNEDGEYLLYERGKQPFYGQVGFPYGKIHMQEGVAEAAKRELKEKTGLEADSVEYRGDCYLTVYEDDDLITQMLCHVFAGEGVAGDPKEDSSIGTCFWGDFEEIASEDLIPGVTEVKNLVESREQTFFEEYEFNI